SAWTWLMPTPAPAAARTLPRPPNTLRSEVASRTRDAMDCSAVRALPAKSRRFAPYCPACWPAASVFAAAAAAASPNLPRLEDAAAAPDWSCGTLSRVTSNFNDGMVLSPGGQAGRAFVECAFEVRLQPRLRRAHRDAVEVESRP